ncbi:MULTISPECIES: PilZ domain-containing protein [Sphingomonas]|uniref:PilZ domain-containing protein n=1 Tax=Sphingomonas TaxID=13687 RepID=UPI0020BF1C80|nr:PilZ domain-containing protein [Sphingomonas faeni]
MTTDPSDKPPSLARATRTSVMLSADMFRVDRDGASQHRVTNISETGLCIAQAGDLVTGTVVVVAIGSIAPTAANVVWVRSGLAGLAFQTPIDVSEARRRRASGSTLRPPAAGWLAELNNPYNS